MSQTESETTTEETPEAAEAAEATAPDDAAAPDESGQAGQSDQSAPQVQEADLPEAQDARQASGGGQIDILLDSPMSVTVRLGQARPAVRELLEMGPGSVLKLDRQVGEPIDLYMRGVRFATGHLVVVDDHLGVRIKEILDTDQETEEAGA